MELADQLIPDHFARCVDRGASQAVAVPYILSPDRDSPSDAPRPVAEAAEAFPGVLYRVTDAFGVHEKLAELIMARAGVEPAVLLAGSAAACCWDPAKTTTACGAACRARQSDAAGASVGAAVAHAGL